jgi:hypothetical protein
MPYSEPKVKFNEGLKQLDHRDVLISNKEKLKEVFSETLLPYTLHREFDFLFIWLLILNYIFFRGGCESAFELQDKV